MLDEYHNIQRSSSNESLPEYNDDYTQTECMRWKKILLRTISILLVAHH